jgi:hypothetical protein
MLLKNIKTIPQQNKVQARMPTQDCYSRAFTNYAKMP